MKKYEIDKRTCQKVGCDNNYSLILHNNVQKLNVV